MSDGTITGMSCEKMVVGGGGGGGSSAIRQDTMVQGLHMASVYAGSIIIQRQQRGSDASCAFPTIYYH